jgi:hypothetical protein
MVFSYYNRLTVKQKRIYQESDRITSVPLPEVKHLYPYVMALSNALRSENRTETEQSSQKLVSCLTSALKVSSVRVKVLAKRPSRTWGELHGLYEDSNDNSVPVITVWMRTAQRRQVVAFKTFLRTLLHELGHHLDYKLLRLGDSLHTEGFYKRESSLLHQLFSGYQTKPSSKT